MNSSLTIEDTLIGVLTNNISLEGNIVSNGFLKGYMEEDTSLVGFLKLNDTKYYEVANEYGNTVYIE